MRFSRFGMLAALACGAAGAMTGDSVAPPFRGTWVPKQTACTSAPVRLLIGAKVVTFVNGAERAEFRKLDQCFTCLGRDVRNIAWLSTEAQGDSPFIITLDGSKKSSPAVSVDFSNDKPLGMRFPLGSAALKQCP
jgi:hypothetical protein